MRERRGEAALVVLCEGGNVVTEEEKGSVEPRCFRVPRDDLGLGRDALGEAFLQHLRDPRYFAFLASSRSVAAIF
jgi:hypothetical protein